MESVIASYASTVTSWNRQGLEIEEEEKEDGRGEEGRGKEVRGEETSCFFGISLLIVLEVLHPPTG